MVCGGLSTAQEEKVSISPTVCHRCKILLIDSRNPVQHQASVLSEAAKGVIPLKTEPSTRWAVNNFECWARSRASSSADTVPLNTLLSHDAWKVYCHNRALWNNGGGIIEHSLHNGQCLLWKIENSKTL